ncbi:hypothetical protein LIPSTDRAFT_1438 [Lipomyces starkeyi NRRL Y-11557]|uniref:CCHC-type domain-containing protein n=1 Tax=Lipomyces starkeyi NRRL Y-11557 TaxID=675824 RepID=A0A1E3QEM5_LIPST|nr:hypothetical protein LIPSTDRAFT_1438 [Lipomyces starkeyi NRRL Y-11557]
MNLCLLKSFFAHLTTFYSDALPSLLSTPNMPVRDVFKALTHFRLQREALSEGSTDSAYTVSVKQGHKPSSFKPKKLHGGKDNREAKKNLKCTHCGRRYHEAKDCRIKKYQLRQIENAQQQGHVSTVKKNSTTRRKLRPSRVNWILSLLLPSAGFRPEATWLMYPLRKLLGVPKSVMSERGCWRSANLCFPVPIRPSALCRDLGLKAETPL